MELVDELRVPRNTGARPDATIQLLAGDLATLPPEHAVDVLVVSAFPGNYDPIRGTLVGGLFERGLDMRDVARHKEEDERMRLGCWLSSPLPPMTVAQFHVGRILCFEPRYRPFLEATGIDIDNIEQTVGFIFRCLNNFAIPDWEGRRSFQVSRVAMPLVATGNQAVPVEDMCPSLLDAAAFWLAQGLPVDELKIVVFDPADRQRVADLFAAFKASYLRRHAPKVTAGRGTAEGWKQQLADTIAREVIERTEQHLRESVLAAAASDEERARVSELFDRAARMEGSASGATGEADGGDYDVFVSYAHKQDAEVREFVDALRLRDPSARVFYDRQSIPIGGQWLKHISDAVQRSRVFVAILSPDYSASPVCWDEFQCAKLREYTTRLSVIRTIRLFSEQVMPPIMGIYSYVDCAEGDRRRLREAADGILS